MTFAGLQQWSHELREAKRRDLVVQKDRRGHTGEVIHGEPQAVRHASLKKPVRFGVKTKMMRPGDLKFSHSTWKSQEEDGKAKTTMTWGSPFHPLPATSPLTRGQQHPNAQSFVRIPVFCSLAPYCLRFQAIWFWYVINLSAKPLFICIHQDLKL